MITDPLHIARVYSELTGSLDLTLAPEVFSDAIIYAFLDREDKACISSWFTRELKVIEVNPLVFSNTILVGRRLYRMHLISDFYHIVNEFPDFIQIFQTGTEHTHIPYIFNYSSYLANWWLAPLFPPTGAIS